MKPTHDVAADQPEPVTPGLTKELVRAHACLLFRDKLVHEKLSLDDWVLAEKDLVQDFQATES